LILIPVQRGGDLLRRCLDGVSRQRGLGDVEVLCVDQGMSAGLADRHWQRELAANDELILPCWAAAVHWVRPLRPAAVVRDAWREGRGRRLARNRSGCCRRRGGDRPIRLADAGLPALRPAAATRAGHRQPPAAAAATARL